MSAITHRQFFGDGERDFTLPLPQIIELERLTNAGIGALSRRILTNQFSLKLHKASFGDGYTQTAPAGLNHIRRIVTLAWDVLAIEEADEITAFLKARGGYLPFYYRIPGEADSVKWTCEEWTRTAISGGYWSINATLRQSFTLAA